MSDERKAVFLSYASQDAEAAKRICDALRGAGVEVWFDQSELVGGDQWDQKIRGQIGSCALFVPLISANTQARLEGYFRLEWKLAAQRTHTMADERTFLLPILLDGTRDAEAKVPGEFKAVQWTKLPGGETPPAIAARVKKLLEGDDSTVGGALRPDAAEPSGHKAPPTKDPRGLSKWWWVPAIFGVTMAMILVLKEGRKDPAPSPAVAPAASPALPHSKAGQLLAQARSLYQPWWLASADDLELAEQLLKDATALEPANADVAAASAMVAYAFWTIEEDQSDARYEMLRSHAQRALRLAPEADTSKLAQALSLVARSQTKPEGMALLEQLAQKNPRDVFLLQQLGLGQSKKEAEQALVYLRRAASLAPADPNPLYAQAMVFWLNNRFAEMIPAFDTALALRPDFARAYILKNEALRNFLGDLKGAKVALEKMPQTVQASGEGAAAAVFLWYWCRDPDKCLAALQLTGRDYVRTTVGPRPKALIAGQVHRLAGRLPAAEVEWRSALRLVEQRLAQGGTRDDRLNRAYLLAVLGDPVGGAAELLKFEQLTKQKEGEPNTFSLHTYAALGRHEAVIKFFERQMRRPQGLADWVGDVLYDPEYDATRALPAFQPLIAEARKILEKNRAQSVGPNPGPDDKSVAVLAFANLSDDKANEYFSDGISEELLTVLQKIPGLHVAARTSAFSFKGKNATAQEIGTTLNVAHLVEGSVQKIGNRVKISARLSRVANGEQLWSENFTRDLADVFAVQSEIAQTIVVQLRGQLTGESAAVAKAEIQAQVRSGEKGGTKNAAAHEFYLRGKFFANQASMENMRRAEALFQRAVELDPQFAQAWADWSSAASYRAGNADTRIEADEALGTARRTAERALAAEPNLAAAQLARYDVQVTDFDWKGAAESLRLATKLAPRDADVLSRATVTAYFSGQREMAIELGRQAVALDPVHSGRRFTLGLAFMSARRFTEAEGEFRRMGDLVPGSGHHKLSENFTLQGRFDEAAAEARLASAEWSRLYTLAMVQWAQKKTAESDATLARLIETSADVSAYQVAMVYAFRQENDRAFEWLERAYRQRDGGLTQLKLNLLFESLHADPRWPAYLKKIGLADEQFK